MSEACTLTVHDVDEFTECLVQQRDGVIRIMSMADSAIKGSEIDWDIIFEALRGISAGIVFMQDVIDIRTTHAANEARS